MRELILRADDLGYSRGVNYGIRDAVEAGLIQTVGVMIAMPEAGHGLRLMDTQRLCLGLHFTACCGRPACDPAQVPSLVDEEGFFHSSHDYRSAGEDFVSEKEAGLEVRAQMEKFIGLVGRKPDYLDCHAAITPKLARALEETAGEYGVKYSAIPADWTQQVQVGGRMVRYFGGSVPDKTPLEQLQAIVDCPEEGCGIVIYHPGYLDEIIMTASSLTYPRIHETAMLCSDEARGLLQKSAAKCITYREL